MLGVNEGQTAGHRVGRRMEGDTACCCFSAKQQLLAMVCRQQGIRLEGDEKRDNGHCCWVLINVAWGDEGRAGTLDKQSCAAPAVTLPVHTSALHTSCCAGGTVALYAQLCRTMGVSPFGTMRLQDHQQVLAMTSGEGRGKEGWGAGCLGLGRGQAQDGRDRRGAWRLV